MTSQPSNPKKLRWAALTAVTFVMLLAAILALWTRRDALLWVSVTLSVAMAAVLAWELHRVEKSKAFAHRANLAKGRFLANISEDIRTPMDGVVGMTDLLLLSGLTADQEEFARTVKASARDLLTTLNEMLDFSRIIDGQVQFHSCDFELRELIDDTAARYAQKAAEKGLAVFCHVAPNLPEVVHGDPVRLQHVLDQLISNAVKFTAKGEVRVYARRVADTDSAHIIHFEVSDTGPGISPVDRARIFDSYAAVRSDRNQAHRGGMGLAIAKQIVTAAGGSIDFDSEAGKGSTFWVVLPLAWPSMELMPLHVPTPLAGARVLIATRSAPLRRSVADYCRSFGMQLVDAHSPSQLLDVVISDGIEPVPQDVPLLVISRLHEPAPANATVVYQPVRRRELETALILALSQNAARHSALTAQ